MLVFAFREIYVQVCESFYGASENPPLRNFQTLSGFRKGEKVSSWVIDSPPTDIFLGIIN